MMIRRRDLEKAMPRRMRRALNPEGNRIHVYDPGPNEPLIVMVGAAHETDAEMEALAEQHFSMLRAAALLLTPAEGGMQ